MLEIMEVIMETYKAEKKWILNYLTLASISAFYLRKKDWCYMRSSKVIQNQLNSEIKEHTYKGSNPGISNIDSLL